MAFRFKLQKVLEYRKQLEEQAMLALSKVLAARDAEAQRQERLRVDLAAQLDKMRDSAAMNGAERWLCQTYVQALQFDIKQSTSLLAQLEEQVAICRNELVGKAQERELLDKLKSKQSERHAADEKLREQREYDETATIRHSKKEAV